MFGESTVNSLRDILYNSEGTPIMHVAWITYVWREYLVDCVLGICAHLCTYMLGSSTVGSVRSRKIPTILLDTITYSAVRGRTLSESNAWQNSFLFSKWRSGATERIVDQWSGIFWSSWRRLKQGTTQALTISDYDCVHQENFSAEANQISDILFGNYSLIL